MLNISVLHLMNYFHVAVLILRCLMLHYLLHYVNVLLFFVAVVVVALATVTLFNVALF